MDPTDAPRLVVQRRGGEPQAPTTAINFVLRSLLFDPSKPVWQRTRAIALRLRLSSKVLLSARHTDAFGLTVSTDQADGRGLRLRTALLDGSGTGARSTGDLFADLLELIVERCIPAVRALDEDLYNLRATLYGAKTKAAAAPQAGGSIPMHELAAIRHALAPLRQEAIWLLRYIRPQRDALEGLLRWAKAEDEVAGGQDLLSPADMTRVREATFKLASLVDQLDALGNSGAVLQDELVALNTELIASSDHKISRVGLGLSLLVLVQLGVDLVQFAHSAGLVDLNELMASAGLVARFTASGASSL